MQARISRDCAFQPHLGRLSHVFVITTGVPQNSALSPAVLPKPKSSLICCDETLLPLALFPIQNTDVFPMRNPRYRTKSTSWALQLKPRRCQERAHCETHSSPTEAFTFREKEVTSRRKRRLSLIGNRTLRPEVRLDGYKGAPSSTLQCPGSQHNEFTRKATV